MNKEPEPLSKEELLRIENIQLKRELVNNADTMLVMDIARAHMLDVAEYGKTWAIQNGHIVMAAVVAEEIETVELAE